MGYYHMGMINDCNLLKTKWAVEQQLLEINILNRCRLNLSFVDVYLL